MRNTAPTRSRADFEISEMTWELIDKIRRNRISSTEVADCLDKTGAILNIMPLNRGHFQVGPVFWTYACNETNWELHEQVAQTPEDAVVLVESFECNDRAIFGGLVAKYLMLYRQVSGIVVQGKLRDIPYLYKENWPIWCQGVNPIGCFNTPSETPFDPEIVRQRKALYDGTVAVCDDTGVVIIPKEFHNREFMDRLDWIEEQEDIWFDCIDRRKWDTYETVCLKKYLDSPEMPDQPRGSQRG